MIVDRLIKSTHFLAVRVDSPMSKFANICVSQVVRLHDIPVTITFDRDSRFTSNFSRSLQDALGMKLQFSIVFILKQTDKRKE